MSKSCIEFIPKTFFLFLIFSEYTHTQNFFLVKGVIEEREGSQGKKVNEIGSDIYKNKGSFIFILFVFFKGSVWIKKIEKYTENSFKIPLNFAVDEISIQYTSNVRILYGNKIYWNFSKILFSLIL